VNEDQWFPASTLVTDVHEMKYYKDEQLLSTRTTLSPCLEQNTSGVKTASFIIELKDGDYPILLGFRGQRYHRHRLRPRLAHAIDARSSERTT
jgi:hypothetical protein